MTDYPDCVLLIEDDEADQYIARYLLGKHWPDCEILVASDGQEAIDILSDREDTPPDLIFLDINMPRMNGHDFLANWYHAHNLDVPVVVMLTSSEQTDDRERTSAFACVRDYLVKPITVEAMDRISATLTT